MTQAEIDAVIESMYKEGMLISPPKEDGKFCFHNWETYIGYTDIFDYCTKCDLKSHPPRK